MENDIEMFSQKGNILVLGDFHARTGEFQDFVSKDGHEFIPNDSSEFSVQPKLQNSFHKKLNSHGKKLLALCKTFDLKILNDRSNGDHFGNFTYHGKNAGRKCYRLHNFRPRTFLFIVQQPSYLSDHSRWLRINSSFPEAEDTNLKLEKLKPLPSRYIWTNESAVHFRLAIETPDIVVLINDFLQKDFSNTLETVNDAVHHANSILIKAASMSLKLSYSI